MMAVPALWPRQTIGWPGVPLRLIVQVPSSTPAPTRNRSPGAAAFWAAARPRKKSRSVPVPPPEPGTTWRPRAVVGTSSRSPGRRARLAVLQPDEGVLVVVALDDPVDAQRAQGRALQLRIAQGPREVGGRCRHATGQHGKFQGAKEWESHCRSTLMVLMDATSGASLVGQAAAISSAARARLCPASRSARLRGCRGRGGGLHEVRESPGNEILIPGRLETRMRRRLRPQMVDISG